MKMKDAIKLGIGFYIGQYLAKFLNENCALALNKGYGKFQDICLGVLDESERETELRKLRDDYVGTKYRKQPVTNKKNPIGFV